MNLSDVTDIVIHCSATRPGQEVDASVIDRMHRARGFSRIGYHRVIKRNGTIEYGRMINRQGAGVRGHNTHTVHICMVGGIDEDEQAVDDYTLPQWGSLKKLVREFKAIFPEANVLGHRDFSPDLNGDGSIDASERIKECPCFEVKAWWENAQGLPG